MGFTLLPYKHTHCILAYNLYAAMCLGSKPLKFMNSSEQGSYMAMHIYAYSL